MTELVTSSESTPPPDETPAPPVPPRRSPGHRGQDVRDTVAELAARAHEISLEAGSKMASALKDVINAAAGISSFAADSARDLVNYFVRRGQMTQDEADKLLREAEEASEKRGKPAPRLDGSKKPVVAPVARAAAPAQPMVKPVEKAVAKPAPVKAKPAAPVAKKAAAKKPAPAKAAKKATNKK